MDPREEIGRSPQVLDRELEEELLTRAAQPRLDPDGVVIEARGDRLVIDGGIRRESRHRVLVDETLDRSLVEHSSGDVVQPEALPPLVKRLGGLHALSFAWCDLAFVSPPRPVLTWRAHGRCAGMPGRPPPHDRG